MTHLTSVNIQDDELQWIKNSGKTFKQFVHEAFQQAMQNEQATTQTRQESV